MIDTTLSPDDFSYVADLVRRRSALLLEPGKEYLIQSRLAPLADRHGYPSLAAYLRNVRLGDQALVAEIVEAMVTTETFFFRDIHPFETLRKTVLPELIELRRPQRQLNIWCAACSSGQEPYSIAMLLKEYFPELAQWRVHLSATDLSEQMLARSRSGKYSQIEVNRGLPTPLLLKWFQQQGTTWQIDERIRQMVSFSAINLAEAWPPMPMWDLIFLRNVMIYFETDVKKAILTRASRTLHKDGYLILGGAETTLNLCDAFRRIESLKSGFYQWTTPKEVFA